MYDVFNMYLQCRKYSKKKQVCPNFSLAVYIFISGIYFEGHAIPFNTLVTRHDGKWAGAFIPVEQMIKTKPLRVSESEMM